jgi:hypothetical protein
VYNDALQYYYSIYLAKLVNDTKQEYKPEVQEVEIASPRVQVIPHKMFKLEEGDSDEQ